jgi:hypothetical protein
MNKPIGKWVITTVLVLPLLAGAIVGGIWLAAEPLCLRCFSKNVYRSHLVFPGPKVAEYTCINCAHKWKPLNLNRITPGSCIGILY